jgi:multimeric flavodoxin WrbA
MSRIIVFKVSAREKGYSNQLIDQAVTGAESEGAEVSTYNLNDGINGCRGCLYCRTHEGCSQKDNLAPFFEEYKDACGFIIGFPIYFGNISGQGKVWLDRMYPLLAGDFSPRYPGKKCVTIYSQGNPDRDFCRAVIDKNNDFIRMMGVDIVDSILVSGTESPGYLLPEELKRRAFEAGAGLAAEGGRQ